MDIMSIKIPGTNFYFVRGHHHKIHINYHSINEWHACIMSPIFTIYKDNKGIIQLMYADDVDKMLS